ncbi:hypothetical protein [Ralstonia insidiosa]|uniref:hypothetical protein n=1 Tax=Ralstonia insidiosa TaxID=190721 RepID=UPI000CEEA630|nr:hypothetical protein [Ralstonia insidiosa]
MQNVNPIFQLALAVHAPAVRYTERKQGSGGVYTFRGYDADQVRMAALDRKHAIDPMRDPAIGMQYQDGEEFVVELTYYGLD